VVLIDDVERLEVLESLLFSLRNVRHFYFYFTFQDNEELISNVPEVEDRLVAIVDLIGEFSAKVIDVLLL
jgi:hypothetical protein